MEERALYVVGDRMESLLNDGYKSRVKVFEKIERLEAKNEKLLLKIQQLEEKNEEILSKIQQLEEKVRDFQMGNHNLKGIFGV